jgi:hypothetical protein
LYSRIAPASGILALLLVGAQAPQAKAGSQRRGALRLHPEPRCGFGRALDAQADARERAHDLRKALVHRRLEAGAQQDEASTVTF